MQAIELEATNTITASCRGGRG